MKSRKKRFDKIFLNYTKVNRIWYLIICDITIYTTMKDCFFGKCNQ